MPRFFLVVEQSEACAGQGDAVLVAGVGNLARADRPAGLGDAADAVTACVIDIVAEGKMAVGGERHPGQAPEPLRALGRAQFGDGPREYSSGALIRCPPGADGSALPV